MDIDIGVNPNPNPLVEANPHLLRGRAWVAQFWAKSVGAVRLLVLSPFLL